ncbi:MAG TPA: hypothetical protein VFV50_03855 [Bdellovibrionales bacterium]|nr:hypothetical protein [Bdellovibrionales bacterium]
MTRWSSKLALFVYGFVILALSHLPLAPAEAAKRRSDLFSIEMDVHIDGRLVASPRLVAPVNTKAAITQSTKQTKEKVYVAVETKRAPNPRMPDALLMTFKVIYVKGKQRKIVSEPQILAQLGERAEITMSDDQNDEALKLSVVARAPKNR